MRSAISIVVSALSCSLFAGSDSVKFPEVQKIIRPYTPELIDIGRITTADSAVFTQPRPRAVLNERSTAVEVIPRCLIDSMMIFVRHSYSKVDTLAHLQRPPWRTEWNYAHIPDQDQIHLQFGYRIVQPGGKIITSPSLPHQWAIVRSTAKSRKKYRCAQIAKPDTIIIDGKPDDWKHIRRAAIDNSGEFALCWSSATVLTPATLHLLAQIRSRTVLATDIIELHLDPYRTRTPFASEKHRSILFAPRGRSYTFAAESTDTRGYRQCDSIAALINVAMKWSASVHDSGYIFEASIPFYTLSEMKHPPRKFGLDVTIRSGSEPFHFAGWANNNQYTRYNPGTWGTIVLSQRTFPLTVMIGLGALIVIAIAVALTVASIRTAAVASRINRKEATGGSPELHRIREHVTEHRGDYSLSIDAVAAATGLSAQTVTAVLRDELDSTFERFVGFGRVEAAKLHLADPALPLESIAQRCGFSSVDEMTLRFREYLHTDPEELRGRMSDSSSDDDDEPTHRSRNDAGTSPGFTDTRI